MSKEIAPRGEKLSALLVRAVGYVVDRTPESVLAMIVIVAGYVHYWWWVSRGRKKVKNDD